MYVYMYPYVEGGWSKVVFVRAASRALRVPMVSLCLKLLQRRSTSPCTPTLIPSNTLHISYFQRCSPKNCWMTSYTSWTGACHQYGSMYTWETGIWCLRQNLSCASSRLMPSAQLLLESTNSNHVLDAVVKLTSAASWADRATWASFDVPSHKKPGIRDCPRKTEHHVAIVCWFRVLVTGAIRLGTLAALPNWDPVDR